MNYLMPCVICVTLVLFGVVMKVLKQVFKPTKKLIFMKQVFNVPHWVHYLACDDDGYLYGCEYRPVLREGTLSFPSGGNVQLLYILDMEGAKARIVNALKYV